MKRLLLLLLLLFAPTEMARAGIFFGKKPPKPNPADRVPQLLSQVKNDGDENKRGSAAEELRQYDPREHPAIVPTLIEVLQTDKKPYVRTEAAQTLGKLRPLQPEIAAALEQALARDSSMRVRLQARSSLLQYHWNGVHGPTPKKEEPRIQPRDAPRIQTNEPPLAEPSAPPTVKPPLPSPEPPTITPPVSEPRPVTVPSLNPLPVGPANPPAGGKAEKGPELPPAE